MTQIYPTAQRRCEATQSTMSTDLMDRYPKTRSDKVGNARLVLDISLGPRSALSVIILFSYSLECEVK